MSFDALRLGSSLEKPKRRSAFRFLPSISFNSGLGQVTLLQKENPCG
jgi:hypothetical protein